MNVKRICSLGYFDRVTIDGFISPMSKTNGITLVNDGTLSDSINNNDNSYRNNIGKIRVTIYGESKFNINDDKLLNMRWHREKELGLARNMVGKTDRYAIAYADFVILKSDSTLPINVIQNDKSNDDIGKLAKSEDEYMLLTSALQMQNEIVSKGIPINKSNIAIVDRVYVHQFFRHCGISSWIHDNIGDILKTYGMIDISGVILIPGDFNNEAEKVFRVSQKEYKKMLINHYKNHGYKFLDKYVMYKSAVKHSGLIRLVK